MPDKFKKIFEARNNLMDNVNPDGDFDRYFTEEFYIDTWYDNPFYGRVDTRGYPIIPKEQKLRFASFASDPKQVQVIDFVAELFKNIKREYEINYKRGNINKKSLFFKENLSATAGFSNSRPLYLEKIKSVYSKFLDQIINGGYANKINSYNIFLEELKIFIQKNNFYFTRAGFVESREFSPLYTGLVLDVYNGNTSDTGLKESFYKDINYPAFLELCLKQGFILNKEIPWRITCDITKKNVAEKIAEVNETASTKFNPTDFDISMQKLFDVYHDRVLPYDEKDFEYFREFIIAIESFYSSFIFQFPTYKTLSVDKCGKSFTTLNNKDPLKKHDSMDDMYKFYMKLFFDFRKIEIKDNINDEQYTNLVASAIGKFEEMSKTNIKVAVCQSIAIFNDNVSTLPFRERSINQGGPIKGPA